MIEWFKRLFRRDRQAVQERAPFDIDTATQDELIEENLRLGRQIDELRDRRRLINYRAAQLRDGSQ